ncbi:hypothetical protein CO046_01415 [Candidatus Peregrinibacteria bacterium CG_4_9_14_0_2_um_filter_53_11]|nr:MAG: hypothetical protein CO046_01415 [Candidatus Peregrinibacteria bacterium CG_4_9_14_0_2_um_filter_53_11]
MHNSILRRLAAATLTTALLVLPVTGLAAPTSSNSVSGSTEGTQLSCWISATTKLTEVGKNELTYSINYESSSANWNATYSLQAAGPEALLYTAGGSTLYFAGDGRVFHKGAYENSFTYPIKDNSEVSLQAILGGVRCTSATVATVLPKPPTGVKGTTEFTTNPNFTIQEPASGQTTLNGGTTSGAAAQQENDGAQVQPADPNAGQPTLSPEAEAAAEAAIRAGQVDPSDANSNPPVSDSVLAQEDQSCKVIAAARINDDKSVTVGAAISYEDLNPGTYPYVIRGFYNSDPVGTVTKYTGDKKATLNRSGTILAGDGVGFRFTFTPKAGDNIYVVNATLGGIDCSTVAFAAPAEGGSVAVDNSTGSKSDEVGTAGSNLAEYEAQRAAEEEAAVGAGSSTTNDGYTIEQQTNGQLESRGLSDEDRELASELNLLEEDEAKVGSESESAVGEIVLYTLIGLLVVSALYFGIRASQRPII